MKIDIQARLKEAVELESNGDIQKSLDVIFNTIDDLFLDGQFTVVNDFLVSLKAEDLTTQMIVGILSISSAAKDKLPARCGFFDNCWKVVEGRGRDVKRLLQYLD